MLPDAAFSKSSSTRRSFSAACLPCFLLLLFPVLGCSVAEAPEAVPDVDSDGRTSVSIRWTTAAELENYGYHVYRGLTAEGPFERLTESVIAGAGTTDLAQSYLFEDPTAETGKTYYYYVESVSLTGERRRFTPIRAVQALPPKENQ